MKNGKYVWAFVALTGLYISLTFALPLDPKALARYQTSETNLRLLGLTVTVPLLLIFFFALYGFLRFKDYAASVAKTKEGPALGKLANGLMVLAFSLPLSSIISSLLNYVSRTNPDLLPTAIIVKNYLALLFPFIAFMLVARGAEGLVKTLKGNHAIRHYNGLFIIVLSCLYTWLITTRPTANGGEVTYYLPNWLILSTLAIPYLYLWSRGIMAAFHLRLYNENIKGSVYKHALGYLAWGVISIIVLSIVIQLISTLAEPLSRLGLTPILIILYILIGMYGVGYGFVARGAKKLKKIEEA